jgi:hypothetical protein
LEAFCFRRSELLDFQNFSEEEIEQIRQVLHSSGGDPCTALDKVEKEIRFDWPSDSDGEDWDADDPFSIPGPKISIHLRKGTVTQFHIDKVSEDAHNAFTELYHSEEFQAADSFRQQDALSENRAISLHQTAVIFQLLTMQAPKVI